MTDQLQSESNSGPNLFRFAIVAAIAAVLLLPTYLKHRRESSREALLAELRADDSTAAALNEIDEEKAQRIAQQQILDEQTAVSRAVALAVLENIQEIESSVEELQVRADEWEALQADVLDGESGQRIASDKAATKKAKHLLELAESFGIPNAKRLQRQLEVLGIPIKAAVDNPRPGYSVTPEVNSQIADIDRETTQALKNLTKVLPPLKTLANATYATVTGMTLRETIASLNELDREAQLQAEIEHMEQVRSKNQAELLALKEANEQKLADAQRKAENALLAKEQARIAAESKAKQEEEERKLAEIQKKTEQAAEEGQFQADLPDIKRYLATLLAESESLRGPNATLEKKPASYGYLVGLGATADNQNGLLQYIRVHAANHKRPNAEWAKDWKMTSQGFWSQIDLTIPKRGQALLRKWGPKLVEKGMLSP